MLRALRTLLDGGRGETAGTDGSASELDASEGLRFFRVCLDGSGASSSCEVLRLRSERSPSAGSSGIISSLKIECPSGSTPRCEGSNSLVSLFRDERRRRAEVDGSSASSSSPSVGKLLRQPLQRQRFASARR